MRVFVGVTDNDWFAFLAACPEIADLNFWRPSGQPFKALQEGEPFFFKLHAPLHFIVGGGFFARSLALPLRLAWDTFGAGNGTPTFEAMARRVVHVGALPSRMTAPTPMAVRAIDTCRHRLSPSRSFAAPVLTLAGSVLLAGRAPITEWGVVESHMRSASRSAVRRMVTSVERWRGAGRGCRTCAAVDRCG